MIEEKRSLLASGARWTLRTAFVLGVAAAATTVIYFTPVPDQFFASCDRPCHELDWPMICRIKLTIEVYQTLSSSCGTCPENQTECWNPNCVTADGFKRGILTANRQLPGPSIHVCENDILVVDVVNRVPEHGLAFHWRGLPQKDTPFMDGVPMVTQCPIPSYTTFQYKFRASRPGTHMWHAHNGAEMADGLAGALVVRRAPNREPHRALYDEDSKDHVIVITEWTHSFALQRMLQGSVATDALLINGRGASKDGVPSAAFQVLPSVRYRFRLVHAGVISACPLKLSVEGHMLKVIEIDGSPIRPKDVSSITLASGERVDFVLETSAPPSTYAMKVQSTCSRLEQTATVQYIESPEVTKTKRELQSAKQADAQRLDSTGQACGTPDVVCLAELEALDPAHSSLSKSKVDLELELPFEFTSISNHSLGSFIVSLDPEVKVPHISNLTFVYPSSPLVTQAADVPSGLLCHAESKPIGCTTLPCECVHQLDVPLGAAVQLNLHDKGEAVGEGHVFHLHGYSFHIVKRLANGVSLSPAKDSVTVPAGGRVEIRFVADNPGYWLLHDQHVGYTARGLGVLVHVGDSTDMPSPPPDFPKCGTWRGPDFFLT
ncbi:uncharacterized protein LOC135943189 [Cloeon dipterum]|uniref:uncharacterized protein LOC135943189 n=1 Tax=Cloeon dipterum TaxID=197152 RepID=UPI0032208CC6